MAAKRIILITGANTGIGYETVKALVASTTAYLIFVGSRSIEKGEAAIKTLQQEFPDTPSSLQVVQVDVESDESINNAFQTVSASHTHIDVLVNNAGRPQASI
jgi:NAD(P)-dependent dehydrogenase (short-subunit alcohol dehydrogenase family)